MSGAVKLKQYREAHLEFQRFMLLFADHPMLGEANFFSVMTFFHREEYERTIKDLARLVELFPGSGYLPQMHFGIAESYLRLGEELKALQAFKVVVAMFPGSEEAYRARLRIAFLWIRSDKLNPALEALAGVPEGSGEYGLARRCMEEFPRVRELPYKSPTTAGILAFLPGLGHLYCGKRKEAAMSFLLNAVFMVGAAEAFYKEIYVLGGMLSMIEFGWYSGNVYSAINCAHRYNKGLKDDFLSKIRLDRSDEMSRNDVSDPNHGLWVATLAIRF